MFINIDGEGTQEMAQDDVDGVVDESISELEARLDEARTFKTKLNNGTLTVGDQFLAFDNVLAHGYDRTGPRYISVSSRVEHENGEV